MPARLRDLVRAIEALGGRVEEPHSGSHWKAYDSAGRMYPLPAHNGARSEFDDKYIKGLARHFGVSFDELMRRVRS